MLDYPKRLDRLSSVCATVHGQFCVNTDRMIPTERPVHTKIRLGVVENANDTLHRWLQPITRDDNIAPYGGHIVISKYGYVYVNDNLSCEFSPRSATSEVTLDIYVEQGLSPEDLSQYLCCFCRHLSFTSTDIVNSNITPLNSMYFSLVVGQVNYCLVNLPNIQLTPEECDSCERLTNIDTVLQHVLQDITTLKSKITGLESHIDELGTTLQLYTGYVSVLQIEVAQLKARELSFINNYIDIHARLTKLENCKALEKLCKGDIGCLPSKFVISSPKNVIPSNAFGAIVDFDTQISTDDLYDVTTGAVWTAVINTSPTKHSTIVYGKVSVNVSTACINKYLYLGVEREGVGVVEISGTRSLIVTAGVMDITFNTILPVSNSTTSFFRLRLFTDDATPVQLQITSGEINLT